MKATIGLFLVGLGLLLVGFVSLFGWWGVPMAIFAAFFVFGVTVPAACFWFFWMKEWDLSREARHRHWMEEQRLMHQHKMESRRRCNGCME